MRERDALVGMVKAWEQLSGGHHSVNAIQAWLINDMKPAIDKCREALQPSLTETQSDEQKEV